MDTISYYIEHGFDKLWVPKGQEKGLSEASQWKRNTFVYLKNIKTFCFTIRVLN